MMKNDKNVLDWSFFNKSIRRWFIMNDIKKGFLLLFFGVLIGSVGMAQVVTPEATAKQDYYEDLFDTKPTETLVYEEKTEPETIRTTPITKTDKTFEMDAMVLEVTKTQTLSAVKTLDKKYYLLDFDAIQNAKEIKTISVIK